MNSGLNKENRFTVVQIVGFYLVFTVAWIYLFDDILGLFIQDPFLLTRFSFLKCLLYIMVTGGFLYRLLSRSAANRHFAEQELRESNDRYYSLFNHMLSGFASCKLLYDDQNQPVDFLVISVNDAAEKLTGLKNPAGKAVSEIIPGHNELNRDLFEMYVRVASTGKPENVEKEIKPLGIWLSLSVYSTERNLFVIIFDNITERILVEASLRKSLGIFLQLTCNIHDVFWISSIDFSEIVYVSSAYETIWGRTCGSLYNDPKSFLDSLHPEDKDRTIASLKENREQEYFEIEYKIVRPDNAVRWIRQQLFRVKNSAGIPYRFTGLAEDITERKQMEMDLLVSERRLKLAATAGRLGIWDVDIQTGRLIWDDRMYEIYGVSRDSFDGTVEAWEKVLHADDREQAIQQGRTVGQKGNDYGTEFRILHPNGDVRHIKANGTVIRDADGNAIRVIGINRDITEEKDLESKFRQAQKMGLVGRLAGGIAHDFNNILTAIISYGNLIDMRLDEPERVQHYAKQIIATSEKAADLTRGLLAFSRQQTINPVPIDINKITLNMKEILERVIGEDIDFRVKTADRDLIVMSDKSQVEQVLMNLATNARDAMPQGGILTIATEEGEINERFIRAHQYGAAGRYAIISVADNGLGMDKATAELIFEPFYTTKEVGKGTGLGLSIVYGTVKQHNGFINVYSEPGIGTTVKVYLPLAQTGTPSAHTRSYTEVCKGTETVLLVEDDEVVREITKSMLEELGYNIIEAVDGEQAIRLFHKNKENIQLVISDMVMPKLSGKDIHRELKKMKPGIKILYMSGYAVDMLELPDKEKASFISKPFGPDAISAKIRDVLDECE